MSRRDLPWPTGKPCWVDLATTDVTAAQALYGDALGGQFEERAAESGGYLTCTVDGQTVAAVTTRHGATTLVEPLDTPTAGGRDRKDPAGRRRVSWFSAWWDQRFVDVVTSRTPNR